MSEAVGNMQAHNNPRPAWPFHPASGVGAPSAGVGGAASLGPLSVPPCWTMTDTKVESDSPSPPDTAAPGRTFQRALMATITGRAGRPSPRRPHRAPGP
ncbi:hypothetical protein H5P32_27000 [Mycobacterium paraseoulense]|nr:hypothetical protein [Mycobacterium paraseoulense]